MSVFILDGRAYALSLTGPEGDGRLWRGMREKRTCLHWQQLPIGAAAGSEQERGEEYMPAVLEQ